jgi:hypothetical protein
MAASRLVIHSVSIEFVKRSGSGRLLQLQSGVVTKVNELCRTLGARLPRMDKSRPQETDTFRISEYLGHATERELALSPHAPRDPSATRGEQISVARFEPGDECSICHAHLVLWDMGRDFVWCHACGAQRIGGVMQKAERRSVPRTSPPERSPGKRLWLQCNLLIQRFL